MLFYIYFKFYDVTIGNRYTSLSNETKQRENTIPEKFEKFGNILFAEAVNTEINCMQVKIKVSAGRRRHTKKMFAAGKCLDVKFSTPLPRPKNNSPSLISKFAVFQTSSILFNFT